MVHIDLCIAAGGGGDKNNNTFNMRNCRKFEDVDVCVCERERERLQTELYRVDVI